MFTLLKDLSNASAASVGILTQNQVLNDSGLLDPSKLTAISDIDVLLDDGIINDLQSIVCKLYVIKYIIIEDNPTIVFDENKISIHTKDMSYLDVITINSDKTINLMVELSGNLAVDETYKNVDEMVSLFEYGLNYEN